MANFDAKTNKEILEELGVTSADITIWTKRWIEQALKPVEARLDDMFL